MLSAMFTPQPILNYTWLSIAYAVMIVCAGVLYAADEFAIFGEDVSKTVAGFWLIVSGGRLDRAGPLTLALASSPQPAPAVVFLVHALVMGAMARPAEADSGPESKKER